MTSPSAEPSPKGKPRWFLRPFRWLLAVLGFFVRVVLLGWASLAIYYSNLPWPGARMALAVVFFGFGVWALWFAPRRRGWLIYAVMYLVVFAWWATIRPSHNRPWRTEVAVMPRAIIDGDRVRITGFRNFKFRSRDDFDIHYEEREFDLSHLKSVDFYVSYWKIGPVGHTFVSFNFDNTEPLSISIETRPEVGEGFDPLASLFKQFELIYVIGDERDLVGLRVLHRDEDVFLYRLQMTPESARRFLLTYLERVNELADKPEWYHLLSNSCTINIVRYANAAGRVGSLDFRHVLNGFVDRYLYLARKIDTSLPFEELRQRSWINDDVKAADGQPSFSERIRAALPALPAPTPTPAPTP